MSIARTLGIDLTNQWGATPQALRLAEAKWLLDQIGVEWDHHNRSGSAVREYIAARDEFIEAEFGLKGELIDEAREAVRLACKIVGKATQ